MSEIKVVGIDIAKSVFQMYGWLMVLLPGMALFPKSTIKQQLPEP
ncbi:hypothetical protein ACET97_20840 [Aeromonas enteropelogenes]